MNTTAVIGALIAGLATGFGALPIFFKREFSKRTLDIGLGFSAGIMLVASFTALVLPGLNEAKNIYGFGLGLPISMSGLMLGYFFIIIVHDFLPHEHIFKQRDMKHQTKMNRMGLIVLAITLHNFPEGLSVGVGFGSGDEQSGMTLAMAIALQNMPEGLVVALGLLSEGASKIKAFYMALLSGLVEPFAAIIGLISASVTQYSLPIALGFAGGTMLFVICQEILPELFREGHERSATFGVILGIITMLSMNYYF